MRPLRNLAPKGRTRRLGAAIVASVLWAFPAWAGSLQTHVLLNGANVGGACLATNVSSADMDVRFQIYHYNQVVSDYTISIASQETIGFSYPPAAGWHRCVFTFPGSKSRLRGALVLDNGGGTTYVAAEAR
jgi:hypothetical protein